MLKWIADQQLGQFREIVAQSLESKHLRPTLLVAHLTALDVLEKGRISPEGIEPRRLIELVTDDQRTPQLRAYALRLLPPQLPELTTILRAFLKTNVDPQLQLETVRTLAAAPDSERRELLAAQASNEQQSLDVRAAAIDGLAGAVEYKEKLVEWALALEDPLRGASLRALVGVPLSASEQNRLLVLKDRPDAARLLKMPPRPRPPHDDLEAYLQLLVGPSDADNGRRIFFHATVGMCSRCHCVEGLGNRMGPNLSHIGRRLRPQILQAILQPSRDVAPGFRQWLIETTNGKTRSGVALRKGSEQEVYLGSDGREFSVPIAEIASRSEIEASIMPDGLTEQLTDQELRDLLAFLCNQDGIGVTTVVGPTLCRHRIGE
jgi:putative heme-binding domain-containing protein